MMYKFMVTLLTGFMVWSLDRTLSAQEASAPSNETQYLDAINQSTPIEGLLVGGQPTHTDLEKIKKLGFQTIISLRPKSEETREVNYNEKAEAQKLGLNFVRIPIVHPTDINDENIGLLDQALAAAGGRAFIHCRTGNRVGAMLALRAYRMQNMSFNDAIRLGEKAGMNSAYKAAITSSMPKDKQGN